MEKNAKYMLFIFPLLLNNEFLSELSDLEKTNEISEKWKCDRLKIFDFRLMFFIKYLKKILSES